MVQQQTRSERLSPSPKRRRLAKMRPDGGASSYSNGFSETSNGSPHSPSRKTFLSNAMNGSSNGDVQQNGSTKLSASFPKYFGHDREEVTRILIQGLQDLGYNGAASTLMEESGYEMESPAVAAFRNSVLDGQWAEAERILNKALCAGGSVQSNSGGENKTANASGKLLLVENADKNEMLFYLRQQKFLELLEARNLGGALMVLRGELTPLNYDVARLHALSRYGIYVYAYFLSFSPDVLYELI